MILAMSFGLSIGYFRALWLIFGQVCSIILVTLICGFGLGLLMAKFPQIFHIIKIIGGIYILFIAFKMYKNATKIDIKKVEANIAKSALFTQGFVISFTNPKAWILIGSILPKFLQNGENFALNLGILTALIALIECCCLNIYAFGGAMFKKFMNQKAGLINKISAFMIVILGLLIIFE